MIVQFRLSHTLPSLFACFVTILIMVSLSPVTFASEDEQTYLISPEDVIEISVWKEPDLQRSVIVRPDGGISFPLVGDIQAAGKSPVELKEEITVSLQNFIPDALVTVSLLELRGLRIYVTGQVRNPGQFLVGRYVDVLQALTLAGGLTPFANRNNISIRRRDGEREIVYRFNYNQVSKGNRLDQNIVLRADDVVVVP